MSSTTFTLRVFLTGISALVPDDPDFTKATGLCAVLPGAGQAQDLFAADGSQLCQHKSIVRFRARDQQGVKNAPDLTVDWQIAGKRLTLDVAESDPSQNAFNIVTDGAGSIYNLIHLDRVAPGFGVVDPVHLGSDSHLVQAQVFVHKGTLSADPQLNPWCFPSTLAPGPLKLALAHQAILELSGLTAATLVAEDRKDQTQQKLSLAPDGADGGTGGEPAVEVTIANYCDGLVDQTSLKPLPDEDFKWYFQLVPRASLGSLKAGLGGLPLPIPYPVLDDKSFIGYGNCYPAVVRAPGSLRLAA